MQHVVEKVVKGTRFHVAQSQSSCGLVLYGTNYLQPPPPSHPHLRWVRHRGQKEMSSILADQ
jgi:hypothetical protein